MQKRMTDEQVAASWIGLMSLSAVAQWFWFCKVTFCLTALQQQWCRSEVLRHQN